MRERDLEVLDLKEGRIAALVSSRLHTLRDLADHLLNFP
jgi:hypothetical protein